MSKELSPTLAALRDKFAAIVEPLDVHPSYKLLSITPTDNGGPHVELIGSTFAYVVTERGQELERRETSSPDDILYWLVADATRQVATQYELRRRRPGRDSRRVWFAEHVRLLSNIRSDWGARQRAEYDRVLEKHPFNDSL